MNNLNNLISEHFGQIVGVTGTLLGVVLGYILNSISRYGRVIFYVNNIETEIIERSESGGSTVVHSITSNTECVSISIELDIINTSEYSKKILREINFIVADKDFKKTKSIFYNSNKSVSKHSSSLDKYKTINLQPKEIKTINFRVFFNKDFKNVLDSNWFLEYRNQKNRKYKVRIEKEIY